jgi:flagellar hook assembly protein FlgD
MKLFEVIGQNEIADNTISSTTRLGANYPNPFNPTTTIYFSLAENTENVEIAIYNIKGHKLKQLVSSQLSVGKHSIIWNGTDDYNKPVSSGVYFYQIKTGKFTATKKMMLMK